jgi:hypothetical protein
LASTATSETQQGTQWGGTDYDDTGGGGIGGCRRRTNMMTLV